MDYLIGVDGGGTKTEAVAYDLEGNALGTSLTGFGNLLNDKDEALANIITGIEELINKFGKDGLKGLILGLAGSEVGNNADIVKDELKKKFNVESTVMNDGDLALKALLEGEDGILVIAGTGSTAFGINGKSQGRCGGWGHLLGDEGSAYKISIEAVKKMINDKDYNKERTALSNDILKKVGISEEDDIISFIYSSTKDEIAALAGLVSIHAENGDEYAKNILVSEGVEIAKQCECVYKKLNFDKCRIGLVGGVIRKSKIFRAAFENYLKEHINVIDFADHDVSAAKGAYYIFKKENN